jgi:hypothetical protein
MDAPLALGLDERQEPIFSSDARGASIHRKEAATASVLCAVQYRLPKARWATSSAVTTAPRGPRYGVDGKLRVSGPKLSRLHVRSKKNSVRSVQRRIFRHSSRSFQRRRLPIRGHILVEPTASRRATRRRPSIARSVSTLVGFDAK